MAGVGLSRAVQCGRLLPRILAPLGLAAVAVAVGKYAAYLWCLTLVSLWHPEAIPQIFHLPLLWVVSGFVGGAVSGLVISIFNTGSLRRLVVLTICAVFVLKFLIAPFRYVSPFLHVELQMWIVLGALPPVLIVELIRRRRRAFQMLNSSSESSANS
jgi:hypothetical protein